MDSVVYVTETDGDMLQLEREVYEQLSNNSAEDQRSLTTLSLRSDSSSVLIYTREWKENKRHPSIVVKEVDLSDIADLGKKLPKDRMLRLPPLNRGENSKPFTKLNCNDDIVIVSPQVLYILEQVEKEAGLDFNGMILDIEATFNRPFHELDSSTQDGLLDVGKARYTVLTEKNKFLHNLENAYYSIMGRPAPPMLEMHPDITLQEVISALERGDAKEPRLLKEQRGSVSKLIKQYNAIQDAIDEVEQGSGEVFLDVIEEEGIGVPSIFEDANEAVSAGFDDAAFLEL